MRLLITGSTGYVGSNLLEFYKNTDNQIFEYKRGMPTSVIKEFKPDFVFHSAAEIYKEEEMLDSNIVLTEQLLTESEKINIKGFIYIGSSSEYGRRNYPLSETDILYPTTKYEATKGAGSLLVYSSKVPSIIARPFSIYGKNEPKRRFIPIIYDSYINNKAIEVGPGVHDFIYIDDFINGLDLCMKILLSGKTQKDIINFGTGIQTTNEELIQIFERVLKTKLNWKLSNQKKIYDSNCWVCDTTYHREKYGYKTKINIIEGLEKYIEYREKTDKKNT